MAVPEHNPTDQPPEEKIRRNDNTPSFLKFAVGDPGSDVVVKQTLIVKKLVGRCTGAGGGRELGKLRVARDYTRLAAT